MGQGSGLLRKSSCWTPRRRCGRPLRAAAAEPRSAPVTSLADRAPPRPLSAPRVGAGGSGWDAVATSHDHRGVRGCRESHAPQGEALPSSLSLPPHHPLCPRFPEPGRSELLVHSPHPSSPRSQRRAMGDPKREAYPSPRPPQMPGPGSSLQAGPPPGSPRGGVRRTPPPSSSRRTARQTKPPASAPAALRANPPGTRAARSPGTPGTPGPDASAGRRGHSLDEVAGALLREALLPAAGQVCGDREEEFGQTWRPRRAPLPRPGRPIPPPPPAPT